MLNDLSTRTTSKASSPTLSSAGTSCSEEIAELTKRQKEIRKAKNRITAKIARDKKVAYIHSLEDLLQTANTRIETLEANLVDAARRLDAQYQQINAMGEIMSTTTTTSNLLMSSESEEFNMPSGVDTSLMFGDSD